MVPYLGGTPQALNDVIAAIPVVTQAKLKDDPSCRLAIAIGYNEILTFVEIASSDSNCRP